MEESRRFVSRLSAVCGLVALTVVVSAPANAGPDASAPATEPDRRWQLTICYNPSCNVAYTSGYEFTRDECRIQAQRFARTTENDLRCRSTLGGISHFGAKPEHIGRPL